MRVFFFKLIPQTLFVVRMRLCEVCDNKNVRLVLIECVPNDKIMIRIILFSYFLDAHWVLSSNLRVRPASACCDTWQHEKNSSASRVSSMQGHYVYDYLSNSPWEATQSSWWYEELQHTQLVYSVLYQVLHRCLRLLLPRLFAVCLFNIH